MTKKGSHFCTIHCKMYVTMFPMLNIYFITAHVYQELCVDHRMSYGHDVEVMCYHWPPDQNYCFHIFI